MSRFPFLVLALLATSTVLPLATDHFAPLAHAAPAVREISVLVDGGYLPDQIHVAAGERVRLVFTRTEYNPCSREVVFRELGLRVLLPKDQAVSVDLPALAPGTYHFDCWMDMLHGTIVVGAAKG
jgi:Cu+-exporting ATPase